MNHELNKFDCMCQVVGAQATPEQIERMTSYALDNFGTELYNTVANIAAENGISDLVTEFSMRAGECGL